MTGLTELIGLVCLFVLAPALAWQLWFRSDDPVSTAEPRTRPVLFDYEAHAPAVAPRRDLVG
jgi:hypothetical protein